MSQAGLQDPQRPHFRALARRPVSLSATVVAGGGSWQRPARVVDLGLGGACVVLGEAIPDGSPLSLVIDAPHLWDPFKIDGIVAWWSPHPGGQGAFVGVHFQASTGVTLRRLTELLEAAAFS